jgi:hypothetical protein
LLGIPTKVGAHFVYADRFIIEQNPAVQEPGWMILAGQSHWGELVQAGLYRPLTMLSYGLNRVLTGPEPWGFHFTRRLIWRKLKVLEGLAQ